jgi:hypothetical protein
VANDRALVAVHFVAAILMFIDEKHIPQGHAFHFAGWDSFHAGFRSEPVSGPRDLQALRAIDLTNPYSPPLGLGYADPDPQPGIAALSVTGVGEYNSLNRMVKVALTTREP